MIELAPEDAAPQPVSPPLISLGAGRAPESEMVRSLTEQRFRSAAESLSHTSIGGYGELVLTGVTPAPGTARDWTADVRRVVLFVAHSFTQDIRVYTELELEHVTQAEIEQAYVDWRVAGDYLGLRAGLVLIPMGIVNELHEPPVFNGVSRPTVETVIIPSTWREVGAGFFGHPTETLRYELYAVAGLNPLGFSAAGFVGASGAGEVSKAKAWALAGRVEYEPLLGVVLGASGYASDIGKNGEFYLHNDTPVPLSYPVIGYSIDARLRRAGLECKMLFTEWHMPDSNALERTYVPGSNGKLAPAITNGPVPTLMRGGYVELGYDVLHPFGISHQIVPFARFEAYDTQAGVPQGPVAGPYSNVPSPAYDIREVTVGLSYRPIREVVVKADYMIHHPRSGPDQTTLSFGLGFMY